MKNYLTLFLLIISFSGISQQNYKRTLKLMGSRFDITVVANSENEGNQLIDLAVSEISRIEKVISSWDPNSETSSINKNAGIQPVKVSEELFKLIERALAISKLTNGAFDISYASMDRIWKFDGSMKEMPSEEKIKESVLKVGYENIILDEDNQTIFLNLKGMKIGFGAIGKGYAADKAKALLKNKGVKSGIINASGDLNAWGKQANGNDWMVAITNPLNKEKAFSWLPVKDAAVVTSGNYEKFVRFNDIRYSHIIDPRTGYPSTGIISVSVLTKNAELADAISTSIFVMGVETGLNFINQLKGVECIIVDENNKVHTSINIKLENPN
ncbi:MAG: FAD:protein FMN transferase [Flavobacteriaceae bacterium]